MINCRDGDGHDGMTKAGVGRVAIALIVPVGMASFGGLRHRSEVSLNDSDTASSR
jgi:hypothetical protein